MKTLEQIKNDYAIRKGYEDFNSLVNWEQNNDDNIVLNSNINEVIKIYAMECLKLASDKFNSTFDKVLIKNENNIIK